MNFKDKMDDVCDRLQGDSGYSYSQVKVEIVLLMNQALIEEKEKPGSMEKSIKEFIDANE